MELSLPSHLAPPFMVESVVCDPRMETTWLGNQDMAWPR